MSKAKSISLFLPAVTSAEAAEAALSFSVSMERNSLRLQLLYQGMQGACLTKLKGQMGVQRGGDRSKPAACGFATWEEYIKAKWGFSDDKARRLMQVWQGMELRVKKLPPARMKQFLDFMGKPDRRMTEPEIKTLEALTHKITDAETQGQFLAECGFIKQAHGAGLLKGRKTPDEPTPGVVAEASPELLIKDEIIGPLERMLEHWHSPLKLGDKKKVPLWHHIERAKLREIVGKLDELVSDAKEALQSK